MRLAVVTPNFPIREQPYRGHPTYQTVRRLAQRTEVAVFCPIARYPSRLVPQRIQYPDIDLSYSPPDVPSTYFEYPVFPVITRIVNGSVCAHYLEPYLRQCKPDVILNYWLYPEGYAAVNVGRKLHVPVIVGAVGSDLHHIPDFVTRWRTRQTLAGASFVITKSEHLRQQAIALGAEPSRVRAITNGCDTAVFHYVPREEARSRLGLDPSLEIVLYVGRLDPVKGLPELVKATASLAAARSQLTLVLVGEGPQRDELSSLVARLGVTERIRFTGARAAPEVALWMSAADVLALPSYAEGFPNVLVEALNCGCPVVASMVGGIPEIVDQSVGILVSPRDAAALATALNKALTRTWDPAVIAKRFRRSWQEVAEEVYSVCETVRRDRPVFLPSA